MNNKQKVEICARSLGWIDYPTDSIEQGSVWHLDPDKAPFGRCLDKWHYNPLDNTFEAIELAIANGLIVDFSSFVDSSDFRRKVVDMVCERVSMSNLDANSYEESEEKPK